MKENHFKFYSTGVIYNCAFILTSGSVIQGFMLKYGISAKNVSLYISAMQIVQVVMLLFLSGRNEQSRNIVKKTAFAECFQSLLPILLVFLCFSNKQNINFVFFIIFVVGFITNMLQALRTSLSYKLPYHIIDIADDYGKLIGISGVLTSVFGAVLSFLLSYTIQKGNYFYVMGFFFLFSIIAFLISSAITRNYHICFSDSCKKDNDSNNKHHNIFLYKPFYVLLAPNLLRGLSSGIFSVYAVIGFYYKIIDGATVSILVILSQVGTFLGNIVYTILQQKLSDRNIIFFASIATALFFPFVLFKNSIVVFFIVYLLLNIVITLINNGVPVFLTKHVDYEYIGQYSALRMLIHTLGTSIGSGISIFMFDNIGGIFTLIFAGLCQLVSGVGYYTVLKKRN